MPNNKKLTSKEIADFLSVLKTRFEKNMQRHKGVAWTDAAQKLKTNGDTLWSLLEMEKTGGEPDIIAYDKQTDVYTFCDCAVESPAGRRSICYDREALASRKEFKPAHNAMDMAAAMGIEILTEDQYRSLQQLGNFDTKTSSWILTPAPIRKLGGAIFADRRYNQVFVYHNGASSYYASRGFRGLLKI